MTCPTTIPTTTTQKRSNPRASCEFMYSPVPIKASPPAPNIPYRRVQSNLPISALSPVRTRNIPRIDEIIPIPAITIGNTALGSSREYDAPAVSPRKAREMVAMIEPTYDSKRSAPIPATSPTLSPTLSAITAGLRGSSSSSPASTLPTKSAPTSAAFV